MCLLDKNIWAKTISIKTNWTRVITSILAVAMLTVSVQAHAFIVTLTSLTYYIVTDRDAGRAVKTGVVVIARNAVGLNDPAPGGLADQPQAALVIDVPVVVGLIFNVPAVSALWLLDNKDTTTGALAKKIQTYGCDDEESKNLASLLVNASINEMRSGQKYLLSEENLKAASPTFFGSEGFMDLMRYLSSAQSK